MSALRSLSINTKNDDDGREGKGERLYEHDAMMGHRRSEPIFSWTTSPFRV